MCCRVWLLMTPWTVACQAPLSMGFFLGRILEWVAISFSRGSSQLRDRTRVSCVSCIADGFFTAEPLGKLFPLPRIFSWSLLSWRIWAHAVSLVISSFLNCIHYCFTTSWAISIPWNYFQWLSHYIEIICIYIFFTVLVFLDQDLCHFWSSNFLHSA